MFESPLHPQSKEDEKKPVIPALMEFRELQREYDEIVTLFDEYNEKIRSLPNNDPISDFYFSELYIKNDEGVATGVKEDLAAALEKILGTVDLEPGEDVMDLKEKFPELAALESVVGAETMAEYRRLSQERNVKLKEWMTPERKAEVIRISQQMRDQFNYQRVLETVGEPEKEKKWVNVIYNWSYASEEFVTSGDVYKEWWELRRRMELLDQIVEWFEEPEAWLEQPRVVGDDEIEAAEGAFGYWQEVFDQVSDYSHLSRAIFKAGTDPNEGFVDEQYDETKINIRVALGQYAREDFKELLSNRAAIMGVAEAGRAAINVEELRRRGMIERTGIEYPEEYEMSDALVFTIEGLEAVEGETLLISQRGIERLLINFRDFTTLFPTYFMKGIGKLKFEMNPKQLERVQRIVDNDWLMDGHAMERGIKGIIIHEIFEHAVTKLTLEEMRGWMAAMEADKANGLAEFVSPYVQYASEIPSEYRWEKEDFCESGRLFVLDAYQLLDTAPARFEFMLDYFARHLPEGSDGTLRATFKEQTRKLAESILNFMRDGKPEVVRETWLEHQQPERRTEIKERAEAKKKGQESGFVTMGHYEPATLNGVGGETIVVHSIFKLPTDSVSLFWEI